MTSDQPTSGSSPDYDWPEPGDAGIEREAAGDSEPVLGDILRRARQHQGLSLRQVEQRTGVSNAHLSQIERGAIRRPDPAILMNLAELYGLNYELVAEWSGYLEPEGPRGSNALAGMALRLFVELDPVAQSQALEYLEKLRNETVHGNRGDTN
jgi:transcriptional regulator with XRE-family HTH domain